MQAAAQSYALSQSQRLRQTRPRRRPNLLHDPRSDCVDLEGDRPRGLCDEIDRSQIHGFEGDACAGLGQRRDHDDRTGAFQHDAVKAGKAIHLRHVNIERDHVGSELAHSLESLNPIPCELDFKIALGGKDAAEKAPHEGGIVDDEQPDHEADRSG
jgi:hypothetical protein